MHEVNQAAAAGEGCVLHEQALLEDALLQVIVRAPDQPHRHHAQNEVAIDHGKRTRAAPSVGRSATLSKLENAFCEVENCKLENSLEK